MTSSATKYSADHDPEASVASYITAFQSSPVKTWNTVTRAHRRVSKLCLGIVGSPAKVSLSAHIFPPNICMPSSAKMNTASTTTNANSPSDATVAYMVYRNFCNVRQLRMSFKMRRMRNERSAESDPESARSSSTSEMRTTSASKVLKASRKYSVIPSPSSFTRSSAANATVSATFTAERPLSYAEDMPSNSIASTSVFSRMHAVKNAPKSRCSTTGLTESTRAVAIERRNVIPSRPVV